MTAHFDKAFSLGTVFGVGAIALMRGAGMTSLMNVDNNSDPHSLGVAARSEANTALKTDPVANEASFR
jgi:hypothetical protein